MVEMGDHEAAQRLDTNSQESGHPTIRILASINIVFYGVSRDIRDPDIGDMFAVFAPSKVKFVVSKKMRGTY